MLNTLHISNYALIDRIDIRFGPGLNIITGETGAGKSIILTALSLILGGRADLRVINDPQRKSVIECTFTTPDGSPLTLRRELMASGRSKAFINGASATLTQLNETASRLIDIHSQHQNLLLADPAFQREIIDAMASNRELMEDYRASFQAMRKAMHKWQTRRDAIERTRQNADFLAYQLKQLDDACLTPDDDPERLARERDSLENLTSIKDALAQALGCLTSSQVNILSLLDQVSASVDSLADIVQESDNIPERLESARIELSDIADTLADLDENLGADPLRSEYLTSRIDLLQGLMARHGASTIDELIEARESIRARLDEIANADIIIGQLHREALRLHAEAKEKAAAITASREKAAGQFAEQLLQSAMPLGMNNLQCDIAIEPARLGINGADTIEFRFAFNKNQTPVAVGGNASGGEISRLMLSVKAITANRISLPTIVFDEIDTGVSGDVANRIGNMMRTISQSIQVIAITHLPQIAAKADTHYKVYKRDDELSTHTHAECLTGESRIDEIATMISGDPSDSTAREAARRFTEL